MSESEGERICMCVCVSACACACEWGARQRRITGRPHFSERRHTHNFTLSRHTLQVQISEMSSPSSLTPDSPNKGFLLQVPSPIVTRRNRTKSTTEIANSNPEVKGKVKYFCRTKGHGFITPDDGGVDIFLHISDIEGEYIPLEGDEVTYRLCPIPPKREKYQATHVRIVNFTPEVHHRWDCLPSEGH